MSDNSARLSERFTAAVGEGMEAVVPVIEDALEALREAEETIALCAANTTATSERSYRSYRVWATSRYASAPEYLTGDEGETTFVRRDLADTATAARAWALAQGVNLAGVEADEVEMLPVPEHFLGIEHAWVTVVPGTSGAVRYWRFRL